MKVHFIAIGGSIMHNLALALHSAGGFTVTGSDDVIYEPSKSRLKDAGLLPVPGWDPGRITDDLDIVILGMHAKPDNPELDRALELGLRIVSFPGFVASRSADKKRVVIAGSHGKTTTTSMIMHVLRKLEWDFDYLVGAQLPNFDLMVRLSDAPLIIIEGDEYLSSPIDRTPKFSHYNPHLTVVTGIAWDHMNVFPTKSMYENQFGNYLQSLDENAKAYLYEGDIVLDRIVNDKHVVAEMERYGEFPHKMVDGTVRVAGISSPEYQLSIFGNHNMQNLNAAWLICRDLGIGLDDFLTSITDFTGAAMRMQTLLSTDEVTVLRDFAHAPSKVRATVSAVRQKYPDTPLTGILELHTFSSLNKDFLPEYAGTLEPLNVAIVYYDPATLANKRLPHVSPEYIAECFVSEVEVVTDSSRIESLLDRSVPGVHLWMSSGRFGGLNIQDMYRGSSEL